MDMQILLGFMPFDGYNIQATPSSLFLTYELQDIVPRNDIHGATVKVRNLTVDALASNRGPRDFNSLFFGSLQHKPPEP